MSRWNLSIPDEDDRAIRVFLARTGKKKGGLSEFVVAACRKEVLAQTVAEIHEQNADLTAEEAMKLADEAVASARAHPA